MRGIARVEHVLGMHEVLDFNKGKITKIIKFGSKLPKYKLEMRSRLR